MTQDQLCEFLRDQAGQRWTDTQQPYLLSFVAPDLKDKGNDYRSALADGETLKAFTERAAQSGIFKVVQHPTPKAKVGIVPPGVDFAFEDHIASPDDRVRTRQQFRSRDQIVLEFLKALSQLPEPMLDEVTLPVKVLARLLDRT